jgi:hypothetical protein
MRPAAPAPLPVVIAVDVCLFACAGLTAIADASVWSFLAPFALGAAVLIVYGWKAAADLGIRSREQTPRAGLRALGILGGITAALLTQTGRYAGLGILACLVSLQVAERIIWAHFLQRSHVAQDD